MAFEESQMCESPKKFSPAPSGLYAPEAMDVQEDAGYVRFGDLPQFKPRADKRNAFWVIKQQGLRRFQRQGRKCASAHALLCAVALRSPSTPAPPSFSATL